MAPTTYESLIADARKLFVGVDDPFWSDDELLQHAKRGTTDLWAGIIDLNEEHYLVDDDTNVSLASGDTELSGVPNDVFRVYLIEPRDTTNTGSAANIEFVPRELNSPDVVNARAWGANDPSTGGVIFYSLSGQGAPNGAPTIRIAPTSSTSIDLRLQYIPTLGIDTFTLDSYNPIPGESDNALIAWIVAYARVKERDDRSPDPAWIAIYATEKQSLLTRMTPRQSQEPAYVRGMFEGWR